MAKKLKISNPTVIETQLSPLNTSVRIDNDSALEQWFYAGGDIGGGNAWSPNRKIAALTLTPVVEASDPVSGTAYHPSISTEWYKHCLKSSMTGQITSADIDDGDWVWKRLSGTDPSGDYYIPSYNTTALCVRENAPVASADTNGGITLKCVIHIPDPRLPAAETRYDNDEKVVTLTCNAAAEQNFVKITGVTPKRRTYDKFRSNSSILGFEVRAFDQNGDIDESRAEDLAALDFVWDMKDNLNTDFVLVDATISGVNKPACPAYSEAGNNPQAAADATGQGLRRIKLDATYTNYAVIRCRVKRDGHFIPSDNDPMAVYFSYVWETPNMDIKANCLCGNAVNENSKKMVFKPIISLKNPNSVLSEQEMKDNFMFNWIKIPSQGGATTSFGWGYEVTADSDIFLNGRNTMNVKVESYFLQETAYVVGDGSNSNKMVIADNKAVLQRR